MESRNRFGICLIAAFVSVLVIAAGPLRAEEEPSLRLTSGENWKLSGERGRLVLLAFFADFCKPCEQEVPHLKALKKEFGESVAVIGVAHPDSKTETPAQTAKRYGIDYPVIEDTDGLLTNRYQVGKMLPTGVLLGETGDELQRVRGMNPEILAGLRKTVRDGQARLRRLADSLAGDPRALIRVGKVEAAPGFKDSPDFARKLEPLVRAEFAGTETAPLSASITVSKLGSSETATLRAEDHLGRLWIEETFRFKGGIYAPLLTRINSVAGEIRDKARRGAGENGK